MLTLLTFLPWRTALWVSPAVDIADVAGVSPWRRACQGRSQGLLELLSNGLANGRAYASGKRSLVAGPVTSK
jgi:hypothetical protein